MQKIFGARWGLRRTKKSKTGSKEEVETVASAVEPDLVEAAEAIEPITQDEEKPSLIELLENDIDQTIQRLSAVNFQPDPLAGPHFSKMVSLFSSAYKRHGHILEAAIRHCVGRADQYETWSEPTFNVSQQAVSHAATVPLNTVDPLPRSMDYGADDGGHLQVDILVWNATARTLRSYEVKRGHGRHDAGKIRSIKKEAYTTNLLLKSYGRQKGLNPRTVSSHVIFYYGNQSIPHPLGLSGDDLDEHFGILIKDEVEKVNRRFRSRLFEILADQ